jgi:hypothetical protein
LGNTDSKRQVPRHGRKFHDRRVSEQYPHNLTEAAGAARIEQSRQPGARAAPHLILRAAALQHSVNSYFPTLFWSSQMAQLFSTAQRFRLLGGAAFGWRSASALR